MTASAAFEQLCSWPNLWQAWQRASCGKRSRNSTAAFEHRVADRLVQLQSDLRAGVYQPLPYTHFVIHEPKRRRISAAAFVDRVVHHALCQVIEPRFERVFLPCSFANRVGKGTQAAVLAMREAARRYRYVLRADISQHFPSIDHEVLLHALARHVPESDLMALIRTIVASGDLPGDAPPWQPWPGDDLLAACRPRGLPIGNLTSQFWSNCVLHALDLLVVRELRCPAYVRYVDDFALFSDDKAQLWSFKSAVQQRLARLRLRVHETCTQVAPTAAGIPWLGFVVYPTHTVVKSRKVRHATQRLALLYQAWQRGDICFGEFDAVVQGWVAHVRQADSWGLRRHMLAPFELTPGCEPHYPGRGSHRRR